MKLCIVTATTNPTRAEACLASWGTEVPLIVVLNASKGTHGETTGAPSYDRGTVLYNSSYLGTVPAFNAGVQHALHAGYDIIACLHDDLEIFDPRWVEKVLIHFERHPACGLAGFGGAIGLGDSDIYQKPYEPVQLARIGFRSNLRSAELHGIRSLLPEKVACLDGFSQIGRRTFFEGWHRRLYTGEPIETNTNDKTGMISNDGDAPWQYLEDAGMIHHFYDGALGCLAKRYGWETWYLPISCEHYGGRTAVGDAGYQAWAKDQIPGGDQGFWQQAHKVGYQEFRDVLPIRV